MTVTLNDSMLADAARTADRIAAAAGRQIRDGVTRRVATVKADGSDVTDIDIAVNDMVITAISAEHPDHQILGEEASKGLTDLDQPTWVVDPIDGTMPYAAGVGVACFSLALVIEGAAHVAVVEDPWTGLRWQATRDGGTWRNGIRCHTSNVTELDGARIDVEACVEFAETTTQLDAAGALAFCQWAAVRCGAAVSDGGYAAVLYGPGHPWDVAATSLRITEAGGTVGHIDHTTLHLAQPIRRWVGAATGRLWEQIADIWTDVAT